MKKIGFITSQEEGLNRDDALSIPFLNAHGFEVQPYIWDDLPTDFDKFDALVFRSCWNYHRRYEDFRKWLGTLKAFRGPIFNSLKMIEWNLHKKYLLELEQKGVALAKTLLLVKNTPLDVPAWLAKIPGDKIVIKPAVSLNGQDTYCFSKSQLTQISDILQNLLQDRDVLVQEFLPEIESGGELSFLFFNREFSHALRKVPKSGEFRIHVEYGGKRLEYHPTPALIEQARQVVEKVDPSLLYARVDVVERNGRLILIELEITDPMLYIGYADGAPEKFAKALIASLANI